MSKFSCIMRKHIFSVSNQVPYKPGFTATEDCKRLAIFGFSKKRDYQQRNDLNPSKIGARDDFLPNSWI